MCIVFCTFWELSLSIERTALLQIPKKPAIKHIVFCRKCSPQKAQVICAFYGCFYRKCKRLALLQMLHTDFSALSASVWCPHNVIIDHTDHKTLGNYLSTLFITQYCLSLNFKGSKSQTRDHPSVPPLASLSLFYCCSIHPHHHSSCTVVGRMQKITHRSLSEVIVQADHICMVMYMYLAGKLCGGSTLASTVSSNHLRYLQTALSTESVAFSIESPPFYRMAGFCESLKRTPLYIECANSQKAWNIIQEPKM